VFFKKGNNKRIWEVLFEKIQQDPNLEVIMIDATIVRAYADYRKENQQQLITLLWNIVIQITNKPT
jgi:hypothetical protein